MAYTFAAIGDGLFYCNSRQVSRHYTWGTIGVQDNMDIRIQKLPKKYMKIIKKWNFQKHWKNEIIEKMH